MIRFQFPHAWRSQARLLGAGLALLASLSFTSTQAIAAETLVVTYGALSTSFQIDDLAQLAATGEASDSMNFYLGLANLEPETLQAILNQRFNIHVKFVEDLIDAPGGEEMLAHLTRVLQTPSGEGSEPALRATLVQSTADDSQISLLELLQNYPTDQVYLDSRNLAQLLEDFETLYADEAALEE